MTAADNGHASQTFDQRLFYQYGKFAVKNPWKLAILGIVIGVIFSFGLLEAELETDAEVLWVEKGTRLADEKAKFDEMFGGHQRAFAIFTSDNSGGATGSASALALDALVEAATPVFVVDEPGNANEAMISIKRTGNTDTGIAFEETYDSSDFCNKPEVPDVFKNYAPMDPVYGPYAWLPGGNFLSYGIKELSVCLGEKYPNHWLSLPEAQRPFYPKNFKPLDHGWGLDRFPCSRVGAIDCFREGVFDYPAAMQEVDGIIDLMMAHPNMTTCMSELQQQLTGVFAAPTLGNMSSAVAAGTAAYLAAPGTGVIFASGVQGLWSYGYRWRKSYKDMTDAEIADHYTAAIKNAEDPAITSIQCILGKLPCCVNWSGKKLPPDTFLGKPTYVGDGAEKKLTALTGIRVAYNLDNKKNYALKARINKKTSTTLVDNAPVVSTEDMREELLLDFEQATIDALKPRFENAAGTQFGPDGPLAKAHVDFWNGRTIVDAIEDASAPPALLLIMIPLILSLYFQLNFMKLGCDAGSLVYSRTFAASILVGIVCLAVAAATGLASWMFKLGPANVISVPFVALGIGIDDAYVLMYTLCHVVKAEDPEERIAETMQTAGTAVLLTSTTNFFTLLVCLLTPNYSLQTFSAHLAISVFFNFFLLLLIGVPVMYLDFIRSNVWKRADGFAFFMKMEDVPEESKLTSRTTTEMIGSGFRTIIAPAMTSPVGKAVVILISLIWFAVMVWVGQTEAKLGLLISDFTEEGTYPYAAAEQLEFNYPSWPAYRVTTDVDYTSLETQKAMIDATAACDGSAWTAETPSSTLSWNAGSATSLKGVASADIAPAAFGATFQAWVATSGSLYGSQLYCEDSSTAPPTVVNCMDYTTENNIELKGSSDLFFLVEQTDTPEIVEAMLDVRAKTDAVWAKTEGGTAKAFVYGFTFMFWEQYVYTYENLYFEVGLSCLAIFICTAAFLRGLIAPLMMLVIILKIVVEVYGCMFLLGCKLNAFSLVNLCVTVTMSVEFMAHFIHAFSHLTGTRNERMQGAYFEVGSPIFGGAMTTLLCNSLLCLSNTGFVIRYYGYMFVAIVFICLLNGLFLFPVLLSLVGPATQAGAAAAEGKEAPVAVDAIEAQLDADDTTV